MLRKDLYLLVICASDLIWWAGSRITRMRRLRAIAWLTMAWALISGGNFLAVTVPPGFTETVISGPWGNAVGVDFENNGRM